MRIGVQKVPIRGLRGAYPDAPLEDHQGQTLFEDGTAAECKGHCSL